MSMDVPLKVKKAAGTVVCQFTYEMSFHNIRHIQRYTLHVRVGNWRSEGLGFVWRYFEKMWGRWGEIIFELFTVQKEVQSLN